MSLSRLAAKRIVAGQPAHELSDTFAVLRTRVLKQLADHGFSTLMVVSPNPGEGKSTVAANLAVSIAKLSEYGVLLIDTDLRRPSVHALFHITQTPGLTDYLTGDATAEACMVDPGIPRLMLLPAGRAVAHSAELLSNARLGRLVHELTAGGHNRVVVVDGPPILASDDAIVLAGHVDCGLLVAAEARTPKADVDSAFKLADDGVMSLPRAWALISERPAEILRLADRGVIDYGKRADLVVVNEASRAVEATIVGGRLAYLAGEAAHRFLAAGASLALAAE